MTHKIHDVGAAKHIGKYSDAIEAAPGATWLYSSGTPGAAEDGTFPDGFDAQTRLAWKHILAILDNAGMGVADLVKVTTTLTDPRNIAAHAKIRGEYLGDARPALMLQVVNQLIKPEVLVEIEIIAARQ